VAAVLDSVLVIRVSIGSNWDTDNWLPPLAMMMMMICREAQRRDADPSRLKSSLLVVFEFALLWTRLDTASARGSQSEASQPAFSLGSNSEVQAPNCEFTKAASDNQQLARASRFWGGQRRIERERERERSGRWTNNIHRVFSSSFSLIF
jgi:hypothetical protein